MLGVATLAFGIALLAFNLANEYVAQKGKIPLLELPTVGSLLYRIGADPDFNERHADYLAWEAFLAGQFDRLGGMVRPFYLNPYNSGIANLSGDSLAVISGVVALGVAVAGLIFLRHKILLATLLLSGFCWSLPMRHHAAFHDFQSLFYIGIPLAFYALIILCIRRFSRDSFVAALAVGALLVFVLSSAAMSRVGHASAAANAEREIVRDIEVIRSIVGRQSVYICIDNWFGGRYTPLRYYLSESIIVARSDKDCSKGRIKLADFVILTRREAGPALLTPDNQQVFLYNRALYDEPSDEKTLGSPIIVSGWNVYLKNNRLVYVSKKCANSDATFFLHIDPVDKSDLPDHRKPHGFDSLDFRFVDFARRSGERYVAARGLPGYDYTVIRTGQYTEAGRLWEGEYSFEP